MILSPDAIGARHDRLSEEYDFGTTLLRRSRALATGRDETVVNTLIPLPRVRAINLG